MRIQAVRAVIPTATGGLDVIVDTKRVVRERKRVTKRPIRPGTTWNGGDVLTNVKYNNNQLYPWVDEKWSPRCDDTKRAGKVVDEDVPRPAPGQVKNKPSLRPCPGAGRYAIELGPWVNVDLENFFNFKNLCWVNLTPMLTCWLCAGGGKILIS